MLRTSTYLVAAVAFASAMLLPNVSHADDIELEMRLFGAGIRRIAKEAVLRLIQTAEEAASDFSRHGCASVSRQKLDREIRSIQSFLADGATVALDLSGRLDPVSKFKRNVTIASISATEQSLADVLLVSGGFALQTGCLDAADEFFRIVIRFSRTEYDSAIRRAQAGLEEVRDRRRIRQ